MAELVLSASSVAAYVACQYRWFLQYVEMHHGVTSIQSAVGVGVHTGAEHFYREAIPFGPRTTEDILAESIEVADLAYLLEVDGAVDWGDENPLKMRPVVGRVLTSYVEDVATQQEALAVEQPFRIIVDGIHYSGHIDVMFDGIVADTKVLKQRPRFPEKYLPALTGYALGAEQLVGVPFSRRLDVMIRLKRDRPRYDPIDFGDVTRGDVKAFTRQLTEVAEGIDRGSFAPTGLATGECRFCPVRFECQYFAGGNDAETEE